MRLFFNRYRKAIFDKTLAVFIPGQLRKRLWLLLEKHEASIQTDRNGWADYSSVMAETEKELRLAYGDSKLQVPLADGNRRSVDGLEEFLKACYPNQVLDVVEAFWHHLTGFETQGPFTQVVNEMFEDLSCPWRMDGGEFFAVDQTFMGMRLAQMAEQNLAEKRFHGAYEEFREARQDFLAGDAKGCISNAQKAFESALKTILGIENGNASALIQQLVEAGHVDELPAEFRAAFGNQVLMSLPTMGNRLGRHGQGARVVEVPILFAGLSLELAAAYLNFLVKLRPAAAEPPETLRTTEITDDDIPF